jgi:hypothetical protein
VTSRHLVVRCLRALALALVLLVAAPSAALADAAGPTNYDSRVTAIEPPVEGVEVEVLGGDAYVQLSLPDGVSATVSGYEEGEAYLRFLPDGTIERNEASPTRWLNDARYGGADVTVPPEASAEAPPRWETVATGGTYAWHDHRVHWMSPELPSQLDPDATDRQRVLTWSLGLTIDGEPVEVTGELDLLPAPSPVLPLVVLVLVLAAGVALALRAPAAVPALPLVGTLAAGTVGIASTVGLPPGADHDPALYVLPAVALLLLGVAVAIRSRPGVGPRVVAGLAGLPLVVWGVLLVRSFTSAIVPTLLPDTVARLLVAVVLGCGLAALVAAARTLLAAPERQPV